MPIKPIAVYDRWAPAALVYRFVTAHGFIRIPLTLACAFTWVKVHDANYDRLFLEWNEGNSQKNLWDYIEKRTAEKMAAAEE